ncbi:chromosome segregation protein SMC [Halothermothrix orenii]|uniref:Chromosome partition protein Smc n=1 Tax=Halothermothrix orenii (strain H 168 / OCM 544 / DSM 9562) TaxID=373903 RepID=SMC_HALOH|nr:chromosome segregation protein SMC [Halothermothrix orenii]B8CW13.1 RecName: Full=Chromosome partition protein Smc [Halothermothrix orenii H 168]ACL69482.1 chromosome segregation protein SMC [Halothermothrix orenii H 168]
MFLKKLELKGFKSFAKPITINFESPITAIVGPNGSGKSNIVDAIRWVLGEQSAKTLRGSRMADVIFAGSKDYKALNKASVTLYLDNQDKILPLDVSTVKISRKVNMDGQSDYYLNGKICRLKDIENLLMDTGLGKDTYSIVGQGKIDSIINSRPEKLRELFEEAAGISKYKSRKMDAEKRLEKTNHDLQRIEDLIWELEKQVGPLEKAAQKAKKYRRLKEELKVLEVNLLLDKWDKNLDRLSSFEEDEQLLIHKLKSLTNNLTESQEKLESLQRTLKVKKDELSRLRDRYYRQKSKREEAENTLCILEERRQGLSREKENLNQEIKDLNLRREELTGRLDEIGSRLIELKEKIDNYNQNYESKKVLLDEIKENLDREKQDLFFLRNNILDGNVELKDISSQFEQLKERGRHLEEEIKRIKTTRDKISSEYDALNEREDKLRTYLKSVDNKIEEKRSVLTDLKEEELNLQARLEEAKKRFNRTRNKLNEKNSHLSILHEMEDSLEGYYRGVKNILKARSKLTGIIGVVADQIEVDKKYELAIETALGGRLQNIIVKDDKSARECVDYLKETKGGQATFLPVNMVNGRKVNFKNNQVKKVDGFLGIASSFVDCEDYLKPVIEYLLGRTIISTDLKSAIEIARLRKRGFKIVTLEGDVINSGGAITGGSKNSNKKMLLSRSRKIEDLKKEVLKLQNSLGEDSKNLNQLENKLKEVLNKKEVIKNDIRDLEIEKNNYHKDLIRLEQEKTKLSERLEEIDEEFVDCHDRLGKNDAAKQKLEDKLKALNDDFSLEKNEIENKEKRVEELEARHENINDEITRLKINLAQLNEKRESLRKEEEKSNKELIELAEKNEEFKERYNKILSEIKGINNKEGQLNELKVKLSGEIEKLKNDLNLTEKEVEEKQQRIDMLQREVSDLQTRLDKKKDEKHQIELKITRLENRNERIVEILENDYDVKPEDGFDDRIKITNYSRAGQKVKELKNAIKKLGTVNQGAIEEYNDLVDRLDYLQNQHDDLLKAKESITKVIQEIEETMSSLFHEAFLKVNGEFNNTFKELFNGGQASLKLTEPENLLETGVEIVAQPPGKQLKKLSLMSGGERALTAIALVFAFLKVNPSPFYILDEIDAPLDDANVTRFARYIKEYSRFAQFLIVTHRKNMMAEAETIYGVTMEESGVSKLISLKLSEQII